jgi:hypothetical protein
VKFELALEKPFGFSFLFPFAYRACFDHLHRGFAKSYVAPKGFASQPMQAIINLRPLASANEGSEIRGSGSMHGVRGFGFVLLVLDLVFAMQRTARWVGIRLRA